MPRYKQGENKKIDEINAYVKMTKSENMVDVNEGITALLSIFRPLILRLCNKWCKYFRDDKHNIIGMSTLIMDSEYWFAKYTIEKYTIDGSATYNNFIKSHMDSRIRCMYEKELSYRKKYIFPDPDKNDPSRDMFDAVVRGYSSAHIDTNIEQSIINEEHHEWTREMCSIILSVVQDRRYFSERDEKLFTECIVHERAHTDIARELHISRPRVSQLIGKIKKKIQTIMKEEYWRVVDYE